MKNDEPGDVRPDAPETVTGIIQGDRVCVACGFNLCGQRIVREPKYNLLIARCPECGQAAALQEYPLLGRWANRWAATLAALWLSMYFVVAIGCGMTIFGLSVGTTEISGEVVEYSIAGAHMAWYEQAHPDQPPLNRWASIDRGWWDNADRAAIFAESDGAAGVFWRSSQTTWIGLFFAMLIFGAFSSIALLGVSRSRLTLAALFPITVAIAACALFVRANVIATNWQRSDAGDLGRLLVWPWTVPTTVALGGVFLVAGMLIGRPLARLLARTALPNRFVQSLSVLWTSEGLEPPKPRR